MPSKRSHPEEANKEPRCVWTSLSRTWPKGGELTPRVPSGKGGSTTSRMDKTRRPCVRQLQMQTWPQTSETTVKNHRENRTIWKVQLGLPPRISES
uniref:Uncharacterized protein n=1 Tax=Mustela putorius furo TaxID=9669 RepID=M3XZK3_MUSPF